MHIDRTRDERCSRRGAATEVDRQPRLHASATDIAVATTAIQTLRSIPDRLWLRNLPPCGAPAVSRRPSGLKGDGYAISGLKAQPSELGQTV